MCKMEEVNGIMLYELPNYAYQKYRKSSKGNSRISHEVAQRKLTRNIMLGKVIHKDYEYNQKLILYGHLKIRVNTTIDGREVITGIWNNCRPDPFWIKHEKNYQKISKKLGLKAG